MKYKLMKQNNYLGTTLSGPVNWNSTKSFAAAKTKHNMVSF